MVLFGDGKQRIPLALKTWRSGNAGLLDDFACKIFSIRREILHSDLEVSNRRQQIDLINFSSTVTARMQLFPEKCFTLARAVNEGTTNESVTRTMECTF